MKAIKIGIEKVEYVEIAPTLESLQLQVGGRVEYLSVVDGVGAYIDEEGKFKPSAQVNQVATALGHTVIGIAQGDVIVGPMLLVGDNGDGNVTDVPDSAMAIVTACRDGVKGNA